MQPFAVAPWSDDDSAEHAALPPLLKALRGEWVGVPFGMPSPPDTLPSAWRSAGGGQHDFETDFHGYSSNAAWHCLAAGDGEITLGLDYPSDHAVRAVRRRIKGKPGKPRLDFELTVEVRRDVELPVGIHPVFRLPAEAGRAELRFDGDAVVRTYPVEAEPGISKIAPDQSDRPLHDVALADGGGVDLGRLPLAFKTEELMLVTGHGGGVTLTNYDEGYVVRMGWDADVFPACMLWVSNRGRTAYPWLSRFNAIGIEPVAAPFDLGVEIARNRDTPLRRAGIATSVVFKANATWTTGYWIEVTRVPGQ